MHRLRFGLLSSHACSLAISLFLCHQLVGREILDSRGHPTVEVDVYVGAAQRDELVARASCPSGASTGKTEAKELRDRDQPERYQGKGVLQAVRVVNDIVSPALRGKDPRQLDEVDRLMITLDGTKYKEKLGGNTTTAVSFAVAEAGAKLLQVELFQHLAAVFHRDKDVPAKFSLPRPMFNILNGGVHAGGDLQFQEFMLVPAAGRLFREQLRMVSEVYHSLGALLVKKYGKGARNLGDEGGYAPALKTAHEALSLIEEAVTAAHYSVGKDMFVALDPASSQFYDEEKARYQVETDRWITSDELIQYYLSLIDQHPALISIEDGFADTDPQGWVKFARVMKGKHPHILLVTDDITTTNPELIQKGLDEGWGNSLLLKVNQIGTVSESMDAARLVQQHKQPIVVSHRSGETTGSFISDLAVAIGAQFMKSGATARGERLAKYNRLLVIEEWLEEHGQLALRESDFTALS